MPQTKGFESLLKNVRKQYLNKPVKKKYQGKYGKKYDKSEVKQVAFAIAKVRGIKIH